MFEVTVRMLKGSVNINNVSMSNYGAANSEYTLEIGEDVLDILNGFVERGMLEIVDIRAILGDTSEEVVAEPDPSFSDGGTQQIVAGTAGESEIINVELGPQITEPTLEVEQNSVEEVKDERQKTPKVKKTKVKKEE